MNSINKQALLNLSKPKAVIFDWDNTLVNTWPLMHFALNEALINMGKEPWSIKKTKNNIHNSMREYFPLIFGKKWEKAGEIYRDSYRSFNLNKLQFLPFAIELINKLHENEVTLMVISNKMGDTLRKEAKHMQIEDKFFCFIGSMDAIADKPSKETVELALLGSDLDPAKDHIWFIGDTIVDVECAYNSNCTPIVYGDAKTIDEEMLRLGKNNQGAIPLINDYKELITVIDNLWK
jgi:phosphoglycolate phosphatase